MVHPGNSPFKWMNSGFFCRKPQNWMGLSMIGWCDWAIWWEIGCLIQLFRKWPPMKDPDETPCIGPVKLNGANRTRVLWSFLACSSIYATNWKATVLITSQFGFESWHQQLSAVLPFPPGPPMHFIMLKKYENPQGPRTESFNAQKHCGYISESHPPLIIQNPKKNNQEEKHQRSKTQSYHIISLINYDMRIDQKPISAIWLQHVG